MKQRGKRYGVERCDEGGTLFDSDGKPIDHTWDVVDRNRRRDDGTAETASNHSSRILARAEADQLNREHKKTLE